MELCTPAQQSTAKQRHASMELCTPHRGRSLSTGTSSCHGGSKTTSRIFSECEERLTELSLTPTTSTGVGAQPKRATARQATTWLKWPVGIKGIPIKL